MKIIPAIALSLFACHSNPPATLDIQTRDLVLTNEPGTETPEAPTPAKTEPIPSSIPLLDDAHFDEAIKGNSVVVEFFGNWCGTCREQAPAFDALAKRHPNTKFYRVDVDTSRTVERYEIKFVPTLVLFWVGHYAGSLVGAHSAAEMDRFVVVGSSVDL